MKENESETLPPMPWVDADAWRHYWSEELCRRIRADIARIDELYPEG